ncbi:MAG TPA: flagellin, partial [Chloroflexota bacterium]
MVQFGNTTLQGQRIFAGAKTNADPFSLNSGPPTTVAYAGDSGQVNREIATGVTVAVNSPGDTTLSTSFAALISLRDHLQAGDSTSVGQTDIGGLDAALNTVLTSQATNGAKINRLQAAQAQQQTNQTQLAGLLSNVQDTDYAAAISEFQQQSTVYQASLQAMAKVIQPSLLDYLT